MTDQDAVFVLRSLRFRLWDACETFIRKYEDGVELRMLYFGKFIAYADALYLLGEDYQSLEYNQ